MTMSVSERLKEFGEDLKEKKTVAGPTVREFLSWFRAKRRGFWIVKSIRHELQSAGLITEPDFESAYIDSRIEFVLVSEVTETGEEKEELTVPTEEADAGDVTPGAYADPAYRITKLAAAHNAPVSVRPDSTLGEAVTVMLSRNFSQLPVMTNDRDAKGVVSWQSIGARLALGKRSLVVRELMDRHHEIRSDASIFAAIPLIAQHQYVLVRGADRRITGIITASDLSEQFGRSAEPFLLLEEIENHLRRIITENFNNEDLQAARNPADPERKVENVADLTFGEYIVLLENKERWSMLGLQIDRVTFVKNLEQVRNIRNDVMHFDPDPIAPEDLETLRDLAGFLQDLQTIGVT